MPDARDNPVHGLLQKAKLDAEALRPQIREASDGWQTWAYIDNEWRYLGKLSRKADAERLILAQLSQEDR